MTTSIHSRRRTVALLGIFAVVFMALMGRMAFLQVGRGDWLADKAFRYRMRPTPIQFNRGEILDRNGHLLLTNVVCESIFAQPPLIGDKAGAARVLAPVLGMAAAEVQTRLSRASFFEWLQRKVKPELAQRVKALHLQGIGFAPEKCRYYPEGEVAVHALGIANLDHQGIEGLELTYNQYLRGKNGAIQCEYTARGQPMEGGECRVMEGEPGLTLQTSLDIGLQHLIERDVERAVLETHAKRASIMVMDVKTGELLGLSQWPRYDPAQGGNSDPKARRIYTVADALNPGSIFKPVTASAALQTGVINEETVINDTGCMDLLGWKICNWDHRALGEVRIDKVMAASSNVGFATLGTWLGSNRFYQYLDAFGFTRPTGVDLPGEAVGQWIPKAKATELDLAIQAFGQTLTVTPIQMLTAIGAIANDGKLMWPHLGTALIDRNGHVVKRIEPRVVRQVISPANARLVQRLMVGVVDTGTGKNARVAGYKVGGKTGTATKVIDGVVAQGKYIASFVGFAPYPDPQVVVLISVDEPEGVYYGGQIAAPIFGEVMKSVLVYLNAPPSQEPPPPSDPGVPPPPRPRVQAFVPSVVNLPLEEARLVAMEAGFELVVQGVGANVTAQFPLPGASAYKGGHLIVQTDPPKPGREQVRVPNLAGLSLRQAAEALGQRGLLMETAGAGIVTSQDPSAGSMARVGTPVRVGLAHPSQ